MNDNINEMEGESIERQKNLLNVSGPAQVHVTIIQNNFHCTGSKPLGRKKKMDAEQVFGILLGVIQLVLVLVK